MPIFYGERSNFLFKREIKSYLIMCLFVISFITMILFVLCFFVSFFDISKTLKLEGIAKWVYAIILLVFIGIIYATSVFFNKYISKHKKLSDNYGYGDVGEIRVKRELKKLPDNFSIFQGIVMDRGGNIDFVVTCPAGIFVLEVKDFSGEISCEGERLAIGGKDFYGKKILNQVMSQALFLHSYLREKTGKKFFVQQVIVFSNKNVSPSCNFKKIESAYIVQKRFLNELFYSLPKNLSSEEIKEIEDSLALLVK